MRSSGTACFRQMVIALLLVPSASGIPPQAGTSGAKPPAAGEPSPSLVQARTPMVLLDVAASDHKDLKAEDFTIFCLHSFVLRAAQASRSAFHLAPLAPIC